MKHSPIKIALTALGYLTAGAAVTIGVAWGIAIWVPMPRVASDRASEVTPRSLHMVPADWPSPIIVSRGENIGITETQASFDVEGWVGRCTLLHPSPAARLALPFDGVVGTYPTARGQSAWADSLAEWALDPVLVSQVYANQHAVLRKRRSSP